MKKIVFLLGAIAICPALMAQGTFRIGSGAHLKVTGGAYVVTDNMNVENNGDLVMSAGDGTLKFTGGTNVNLTGTGTTTLSSLHMQKNMPSQLNLQQNIVVHHQIFFSLGNINLGNNNITLQGIGAVNGESESGRIMGSGTGYIQAAATLNAPSSANPGNLGAVISSASNLGSTFVRRGHASQMNSFGNGSSVLRYYDIVPANNINLNATLRFHYLDAELNGHNENNVTLWRSASQVNWTNLGADARDAAQNYVEKSAIDQLYRFTLADISGALPVRFSAINAQCTGRGVKLTWTTASENGSKTFVIQQSSNGRDWISAGSVPAAGNGSNANTYTYTGGEAGNLKYRIVEEALDGRKTYSPVVLTNCSPTTSFSVFPNPVVEQVIVSVSATDEHPVSIRVFDAAGRQLLTRTQNLLRGSNQVVIATNAWKPGTYVIQVEDKNVTHSTTVVK